MEHILILIDYKQEKVVYNYYNKKRGKYLAFDNIKRGKASLFELENKLGLVDKFAKQRKIAKMALRYLDNIDANKLDNNSVEYLEKVKQEILRLSE